MSDNSKNLRAKAREIQKIRELEAIQKNLQGSNGKIYMIARILGDPVIRHGGWSMDMFEEAEDEILYQEDEISTFQEGYNFSGLRYGMHLEINYNEIDNRLVLYHQGYMMYEELSGDVLAYNPQPAWLEMVDKLYIRAKEKADQMQIEMQAERKQFAATRMMEFLNELRQRWGI